MNVTENRPAEAVTPQPHSTSESAPPLTGKPAQVAGGLTGKPTPVAGGLDDPQVVRAVEEYLAALEAGDKPDRQEFLARYEKVAPMLAVCLDSLEFVQAAAPRLHDAHAAPGLPTHHLPLTTHESGSVHPEGRLGDFRILREIGRGGMGVVYEAEQISLGRRVALKVLPFAAALDSKQLQRFKNEAHAAAGLQHTNIVPVYFVGCERGVHFYAMQFVEGQTLAALIQELRQLEGCENRGSKIEDRGSQSAPGAGDALGAGLAAATPPPPRPSTEGLPEPTGSYCPSEQVPSTSTINDQAAATETAPVTHRSSILDSRSSPYFRTVANLGIQAAEALEHAHQLGVIHRDIKPANLMVDARGNLWITDFGLAHCQGAVELTMSGDLLGTLRYMSPEQALAKRVIVDERTDIYSLGVTLYELLTLEPAFPGTDRQEVLRQIAFDDPKLPRRWNKAIPQELETIVLKAMEKNPADRYATAKELADDLQHFLDDKPIRAKRPTVMQRFRKWGRRHPGVIRTAVGGLFLAVLILAVSTGLVLHHLHRAEEAEREKTDQLWREKFARAQALRQSGSAGRRFESLRALTEAAQIARSLEVPEEDFLKLRNEAIACMALPDLQRAPEYDRFMAEAHVPVSQNWSDARVERYATSDDQGNITIRRIPSDEEVVRLNGPGTRPAYLVFSPDSRFLVGIYLRSSISKPGHVIVWDLGREEIALELPPEFAETQCFERLVPQVRWSPDGRRLAVHGPSDFVAIYDVASKKEIQRFPAKVTRNQMAFHPNGKQLAVLGPPMAQAGKVNIGFREGWGSRLGAAVQIRDVETGTLVDQFALPAPVLHFAWGCDGRFIAATCVFYPLEGSDFNVIYIWDVPAHRMHKVLQGHRAFAANVAFNHTGDVLASDAYDSTVRLWNPWTGKELLRAEAEAGNLEFSPDDRFLLVVESWGGDRRSWRVVSGWECRHLYSPKENTLYIGNVAFSPDGRWLAGSCDDGIRLWDAATAKHVAWLSPGKDASFSFDPDGKAIVTRSLCGDFRWPISLEQDLTTRYVRIGPPEKLPIADHPAGAEKKPAGDSGGKLQAILNSWRETELVDAATGQQLASLASPEPHSFRTFAFNPEGTQLALAGQTNMIELWDLRSIREQLTQMGLDWHLAAYPPATSSEALKPLQVQMQSGHMMDREKYSVVLAFFPFNAEAYYRRGLASFWFGQFVEASSDFSLAVALKPDHAEAYYRRGLIHFFGDRRREAEEDFSRAIALCPDYGEAYSLRAHVRMLLGQYPSAVADFSKAIELSGWDKASDDLAKFDPDGYAPKFDVHYWHALALLGAGDHAGYLRLCSAMVDGFGQSEDLVDLRKVVWICVQGPDALADLSWAVRLAEKALPREAKDFDSLLDLGAAHYRAGNFTAALQRLHEAQATDGGGGVAWRRLFVDLFLVMTHARLGHQQEAHETLDRVLLMERYVRADHPWHVYLNFVLLRDEAETVVIGPEAVAEDRRRYGGVEDPRLAYSLACLGRRLLQTHQPAEAEKVLRECLTIGEKKEPDAWATFNARSMLGEALLAQKKHAEAEPLLIEGYEGLYQREPKIPAHMRQVRLTEALDRLVRLYDASEKQGQAGQWRKKLEAHKRKIGGELPPYKPEKKKSS